MLRKDVELIFRRNHVALAEKTQDYPKAGVFSITVDVVAKLRFGDTTPERDEECEIVMQNGKNPVKDALSPGFRKHPIRMFVSGRIFISGAGRRQEERRLRSRMRISLRVRVTVSVSVRAPQIFRDKPALFDCWRMDDFRIYPYQPDSRAARSDGVCD